MSKVLVLSRSSRGEKISKPLSAVGVKSKLVVYQGVRDLPTIISILKSYDAIICDSSDHIAVASLLISRLFRVSFLLRVRGIATIETQVEFKQHIRDYEILSALNMVLINISTRVLLALSDSRIFVSKHVLSELPTKRRKNDTIIRTPCLSIQSILNQRNLENLNNRQDNSPDNELTILSVSNFNYRMKSTALVELSDSIIDIVGDKYKVKLLIAGNGKYNHILYDKFSDTDSVQILGYVNNIEALYASADIFIHFSYLDGYPSTVVEAAIAGLPTIVNDYGAMEEQLKMLQNGYIVSIDEEKEELKHRIKQLATDPDLRNRLGTKGRRVGIQNHAVRTVGTELLSALSPFADLDSPDTS